MSLAEHASQAIRNPLQTASVLWKMSHGPEYVGTGVLLAAWLGLKFLVTPFHQLYFVNDTRIAFPYAEVERVTTPMVFVFAGVVPGTILAAYNFYSHASWSKHETTYLSFLISLTLTGFVTHTLKNAVGRPRPDFLSRCLPTVPSSAGAPSSSASSASDITIPTPSTIDDCTAPPGFKLEDGWRSFPSGHASFAFAGLGFLALFAAGQLRVFRPEDGGRDMSRLVAFIMPLMAAGWIGISRCEDYRHDVYDVGVGALIGLTAAYWSYRRHWPGLTERTCREPYPHPSLGRDGWAMVRRSGADDDFDVEMAQFEGRR